MILLSVVSSIFPIFVGLIIGTAIVIVWNIFLWLMENDAAKDYGTYGEPDIMTTEEPPMRRRKELYDSIYTVLIEPYNTNTDRRVDQTQLRWYEDGYGIYSDDEIDGFVPLIKQGYADDPDALAFADVLERKPIAYHTTSGQISFANSLRELHSYSEQHNPKMEQLIEEFENLAPEWMVEEVEDVAELSGYDDVSEMPFAEFEHVIDRERGLFRRGTRHTTMNGTDVTQTKLAPRSNTKHL